MSDRTAASPHSAQAILTELKRFSDMLVGDDGISEEIIQDVTRSLVVNGMIGGPGARVRVVRWFYQAWSARRFPSNWSPSSSFPRSVFYSLTALHRAALLMRAELRLPPKEITRLLDLRDLGVVIDYVAQLVRKNINPKAYVLIDEGMQREVYTRILSQIGFTVLRNPVDLSVLFNEVFTNTPHLVVISSQLVHGMDGEDFLGRWREVSNASVVISSGLSWLAIPAGSRTYKLDRRATDDDIQAVGLSILLDDTPLYWLRPRSEEAASNDRVDLAEVASTLDDADLEQSPAPLIARVADGAIVAAPLTPPEIELPAHLLEALLRDHLDDARRIRNLPANLGGAFYARLDTVTEILSQPFSEASLFRLANQQRALEILRPAVVEALNPLAAQDIEAFTDSLGLLVRQSPHWRQFLATARSGSRHPDLKDALETVGRIVTAQPDDIVTTSVKAVISESIAVTQDNSNIVAELALSASVSNIFRAIGRYLKDRAKGATKSFNESLDKEIGEGAAAALINIVVAASTPLLVLVTHLPSEFGWIGPILAAARAISARR